MPGDTTCKIGLVLPHWTTWRDDAVVHWRDIRALARHAEAVGFDSLWVVDHMQVNLASIREQWGFEYLPEVEAMEPVGVRDCWSLLAALAEATERVEIGPMVANTGYRNPALLAKTADTIDDISDGRLILGIGAGDYEHEHHHYGFRWDHRVSRFEEALQIIHPLLRRGEVSFQGEYYSADNAILSPRGARKTGPPILIGTLGHGPRMLRLTMEYADQWNAWLAFGNSNPETLVPALEKIDIACEKHDRDPDTLLRTVTVGVSLPGEPYGIRETFGIRDDARPITGDAGEIAEQIQAFADLGISHILIWLVPATIEGVDYLAPALEMLRSN